MAYQFGNKLGEYIHLHYKNYQRQGLATGGLGGRRGRGSVEDLSEYVNKVHEQLISMFTATSQKTLLNELQQNLNYLMGAGNLPNGLSEDDIAILREYIYNHMSRMFSGLEEQDINWETLTINPNSKARLKAYAAQQGGAAIALSLKTLRSSLGGEEYFYASAFRNHVNDLWRGINNLEISMTAEVTTIDDLRNRLRAITKQTRQFRGRQLVSMHRNLLDDLRDLAKDIFKLGSKAAIEGELAEAVLSAAGAMIAAKGQQGANDIIKELIEGFTQGSSRSVNIINKNSIYSKVDQSTLFSGSGYSDIGFRWETKSRIQGKIDNVITLDDSTLLVSTKNYALNNPMKKHITLVSGTNMIYLLQTESAFINHYLNQAVDSYNQYGKKVGPPAAVVYRANEIMKEMLAIKALAGGSLKGNPVISGKMANIFAVNDKSQPCGFRVISMGALFSNIRNNLNDITIQPNILTKVWTNKYDNTAGARITKLLTEVRKMKISASISFDAIKRNLF